MQQASLRLQMARDRAQTGSRRAGERADRASDGWTEKAATYLGIYSGFGRKPFLIEEAAAKYPHTPPDGRAWGAATRLASRRGWIRRVGYAPAASSNGSPKCLWAAA
jgi:hypothetical protein